VAADRLKLPRRTFISLALTAVGCGSSTTTAGPAADVPPAEPPKPKDAAQIAQTLVGGRVSGLIWVSRLRSHAVGRKLVALGPAQELLEGTSVDPLQDLERVFVTGPSASEGRMVLFGEHSIAEQRMPTVLADLVRKSEPPGQMLADQPFPAVRVQKKRFGGVVAFLPPNFVVAVPDDLVGGIQAFTKTGGLPDPVGPEAARLVAAEPSKTLRARGAPRIPDTIVAGDATVVLRSDGGATVSATGQSVSHEQAPKDARELTEAIDDATSVKLGILRVRAFRPVVFAPQGDRIVSKLELSKAEVDQLLGLAGSFLK
jgi:hypothetical protein